MFEVPTADEAGRLSVAGRSPRSEEKFLCSEAEAGRRVALGRDSSLPRGKINNQVYLLTLVSLPIHADNFGCLLSSH